MGKGFLIDANDIAFAKNILITFSSAITANAMVILNLFVCYRRR